MSYDHYNNVDTDIDVKADVDVDKDIDVKIDVDADLDFDVKVDVDKDIDIKYDQDVKVDGNFAGLEGTAEAIGKDTSVDVTFTVTTVEDALSEVSVVIVSATGTDHDY